MLKLDDMEYIGYCFHGYIAIILIGVWVLLCPGCLWLCNLTAGNLQEQIVYLMKCGLFLMFQIVSALVMNMYTVLELHKYL